MKKASRIIMLATIKVIFKPTETDSGLAVDISLVPDARQILHPLQKLLL